MCVMHAPINRKTINVRRNEKKDTKTRASFNEELLKPDPDFVDERRIKKIAEKGFLGKLLGL